MFCFIIQRSTCSRMVVFSLVLILALFESIGALKDPAIPEALFYPFGADVGDTEQTTEYDLTSTVEISVNFPFFNASHRKLFVYSGGWISFLVPMVTDTQHAFLVANRMIGLTDYGWWPWWDLNNGRIYFRQSTDAILLNRATEDVRMAFRSKGLYFFKAKWVFIATWHNVTFFFGNSRPITQNNSFQVVLITDEKHSIAMFNYGWLSWTTGTMSGGDPDAELGGIAAQVGFNAGDSVNFFVLPGSRQPSILEVGQTTNVRLKDRWMFRVDSATMEAGDYCEVKTGKCAVHQQFDVKANECLDVAPVFDCPTLEGPVVIDRTWVEFYCVIPTSESSDQAAFNVTFLFNGEPVPSVPSVVVQQPNLKAKLYERHLTHKLLGQWISCRVFSFWLKSANNARSRELAATNSYWAGIEVSSHMLSVHEGDPKPAVLTLKSTIPITCYRRESAHEDTCALTLKLTTSSNILVRHNYGRECIMTLTEKDWKDGEKKAYRLEERIEIFAKVDSFMTGPRWNSLTIDIGDLPKKVTADGLSYKNMWSRHSLPEIGVYHHDAPQGVCRSTGDPHVTTFDRRFYTIYASGQFTYVQTTRGNPIEVQLRHKPCGQTVSCVCGVAARENDTILVVDMCTDSRLHFVTPSNKLRKGASIKTDANGRVFEINLPSGVKIVGYANFWGMSVEIYVSSSEHRRTEGLCGSLDNNPDNDLKVKGGNDGTDSVSGVVESWRVPLGRSLFDGVATNLPVGNDVPLYDDSSFCTCLEGISSCQSWMADNSFPSGPNVGANNGIIPKIVGKVSTNNPGRRRRALSDQLMTDDIDWEYDSAAFNFSSREPPVRPGNVSAITEKEARTHCQRVLWNEESPVKSNCEKLVSKSDVEIIIKKCILDVQLTGDKFWADDKIPEIQNLCIFEAITANITESNSTIEELTSFVQEMASLVCLPQDCSGHGSCENGTCICEKGYVGSDCALSANAVPNILRTLGPSTCDLDRYPCQKVEMVTKDVKSLPKLICKVEAKKSDNSTQSFKTLATVETMDTTSCKLPTDELHGSLRLLQSNFDPTTSPPEDESIDFYSLPLGNPVLHYSISISNNGILFSNARLLTVYDSKCFFCNLHSCFQKEGTCLINGYCFMTDQKNPLNPEWYRCDPLTSTTLWTKAPDVTVIVVAIVTVVAVILTVIAIFFIIRRKLPTTSSI